MREILFRGKRKDNGEWVAGSLISFTGSQFTAIFSSPSFSCSVDPETVGQYTGLTDKNGRKIFEGDILGGFLDEDYPENKTIVTVEWYEYMWVTRQGNYYPDSLEESDVTDWFEVIGNIYDNPELLKGGNENG